MNRYLALLIIVFTFILSASVFSEECDSEDCVGLVDPNPDSENEEDNGSGGVGSEDIPADYDLLGGIGYPPEHSKSTNNFCYTLGQDGVLRSQCSSMGVSEYNVCSSDTGSLVELATVVGHNPALYLYRKTVFNHAYDAYCLHLSNNYLCPEGETMNPDNFHMLNQSCGECGLGEMTGSCKVSCGGTSCTNAGNLGYKMQCPDEAFCSRMNSGQQPLQIELLIYDLLNDEGENDNTDIPDYDGEDLPEYDPYDKDKDGVQDYDPMNPAFTDPDGNPVAIDIGCNEEDGYTPTFNAETGAFECVWVIDDDFGVEPECTEDGCEIPETFCESEHDLGLAACEDKKNYCESEGGNFGFFDGQAICVNQGDQVTPDCSHLPGTVVVGSAGSWHCAKNPDSSDSSDGGSDDSSGDEGGILAELEKQTKAINGSKSAIVDAIKGITFAAAGEIEGEGDGPSLSERQEFSGFESLQSLVDEKRAEYDSQFSTIKAQLSDSVGVSVTSGSAELSKGYEVEIHGESISIDPFKNWASAFSQLSNLLLAVCAVLSAFIVLDTRK